jgi:hypothetical protein
MRCECSRYAVQFILKSRAFLLELTDYRLPSVSLASCDFITRILTRACGPTKDFDSR